MFQFDEVHLKDNPGVLTGKLPEYFLSMIRNDVEKAFNKKSFYNSELIGHIEEEYKIDLSPELLNYLRSMTHKYQNKFNYLTDKRPHFMDFWVNKQKKYEFNPIHNHYGKIAWVIWVNIPYDLQEELEHSNNVASDKKRNSIFEFLFSKVTGEIRTHQLYLGKEDEGKVMMFPAGLKHTVYPFYTSDGYRISVAGNIDLK